MKYKYKISVVVPIYNVEKYLEETIESVINQTMKFKDIQLILVNDASPDNSEEICLKYRDLFPDNIIYLKQKNGGVSSARNLGLQYVEGKYVNFLDSDDIWDLDVFKKVYKMFESHNELNVIGVRQKYFEAANNYTSLDFKYDKDKIVDVSKQYDHIQLSVTSGFFRADKIGDLRYDSRIKYSEDAKFIYEYMINNKSKYIGFIASSVHNYRKRYAGTSAIQTKDLKIDWYDQTVNLSYSYLLDYAEKNYKDLLQTIQYYIMYDYQWRLSFNFMNLTNFTQEEKLAYLNKTKELFKRIDDKIILEQRLISPIYKHYALKLKYNDYNKATNVMIKLFDNKININLINLRNNKLIIEGHFGFIYGKKLEFLYKAKDGNYQKIEVETCLYNCNYPNMTDEDLKQYYFKAELDLKQDNVEFFVKNEKTIKKLKIDFGPWSSVTKHKRSYHHFDKFTVFCKDNVLCISKRKILNSLKHETSMLISLILHKKLKNAIYRLAYFLTKPFFRKEIWIFTDRKNVAGDNGEALFKYVTSLKRKDIKCYFALDKGSRDIVKMKKYGNVINFDTFKYNLLFLHCKKLISSHADAYVYQPFGKRNFCMRDLFNFKYIFLQHGIIKDDLSSWLNKFSRNFSIFITSTVREYESILNSPKYGYDETVLKLTGLSRYDNLENNNDDNTNTIMLAPTWRASLVGKIIPGTQSREYSNSFKESNFCKFYNKLLNDKDVIKMLKENNYKIRLCLHPSLKNQYCDFKFDERYVNLIENINYSEEFARNKILITDYSSVAFDFAYLNKLIIYNQFDREEFFGGHIYKDGYFSYEVDGFGDVVTSYEELKKAIIKGISSDGVMPTKYKKRVKQFFKFSDKNNSKRIYEEILKLDEK